MLTAEQRFALANRMLAITEKLMLARDTLEEPTVTNTPLTPSSDLLPPDLDEALTSLVRSAFTPGPDLHDEIQRENERTARLRAEEMAAEIVPEAASGADETEGEPAE